MGNERFQNAIERIPQRTPPIWFMRQAGRYHSHYQKLREKHSFMELCKTPELAALVALGPIEDFDFDVSIFFSDLLFPLEALGMGLQYTDSGPQLGWLLNEETLRDLRSPEDALPHLNFQKQALQQTRQALPKNKSLIGFVGGPWTLFTYAVEGKHSGSLIQAKKNLSLFRHFSEVLTPLLIENIKLQFEGGAEIVMLFDTAAGELSPWLYHELVVPELEKLTAAFPKKLGFYSKGTSPNHFQHELFGKPNFAGFGIDHRWSLPAAFKLSPGFVQGNFDEALLFAERQEFKTLLSKYLKPLQALSLEERLGWVCGLGHGVLPKTPEENVRLFVDTVRETFQ